MPMGVGEGDGPQQKGFPEPCVLEADPGGGGRPGSGGYQGRSTGTPTRAGLTGPTSDTKLLPLRLALHCLHRSCHRPQFLPQ